jgi:hypothetical protein
MGLPKSARGSGFIAGGLAGAGRFFAGDLAFATGAAFFAAFGFAFAAGLRAFGFAFAFAAGFFAAGFFFGFAVVFFTRS